MSAASRARERLRQTFHHAVRYYSGFPDWGTFRAWQMDMLSRWCGPIQPWVTKRMTTPMIGAQIMAHYTGPVDPTVAPLLSPDLP